VRFGGLGLEALPNDADKVLSSMHGQHPVGDTSLADSEDMPFFTDEPGFLFTDEPEGLLQGCFAGAGKALEVSSFVHMIESAPHLSLFKPNDDAGVAQLSIEDELRDCQIFGRTLRADS
jgi:hypothetical protein